MKSLEEFLENNAFVTELSAEEMDSLQGGWNISAFGLTACCNGYGS